MKVVFSITLTYVVPEFVVVTCLKREKERENRDIGMEREAFSTTLTYAHPRFAVVTCLKRRE